ncbi:MAG TPA: SatD family protein [Acidimicrobiia bacterium]|nr:SatD family protein [Acidimicrobiia bacterium]
MQVAALIGDVVASRESSDRASLQDRLLGVLRGVSERYSSELAVTLGDEFQGRYGSLAEAVAVSWELHIRCLPFARLRLGLGWGEILVEAPGREPFGQDGPAWWNARDAIEQLAGTSHPSRTLVRTGTDWDELLNAYLTLRDNSLDDIDSVDSQILVALGEGHTQRAIADRLGLHESSVSRRVHRHRLATLLDVSAPSIPGFG